MSRASIERSLSFPIPFLNRFTCDLDLKVFSLLFMGGETDSDQSLSCHLKELILRPLAGLSPRSSAIFATNEATKSEPVCNSALSFPSRFVKFNGKIFGMVSLLGRSSLARGGVQKKRGETCVGGPNMC